MKLLKQLKGEKITPIVVGHSARTLALRYGIDAELQGGRLELNVINNICSIKDNGVKVLANTTAWGKVIAYIDYNNGKYIARTFLPLNDDYFDKFKLIDENLKDGSICVKRLVEIHKEVIKDNL